MPKYSTDHLHYGVVFSLEDATKLVIHNGCFEFLNLLRYSAGG